jgi:hypothetical protein
MLHRYTKLELRSILGLPKHAEEGSVLLGYVEEIWITGSLILEV